MANTHIKQTQGLMGRKHLPKNYGMLFDFGKERDLSFWMYNTYLPLQIAFIKGNGKIGQIEQMVPLSTRAIKSDCKYRYALEVIDGWFDKNNVKVGAAINVAPQASPQSPANTNEQQVMNADTYDVQIVESYKDILKRADEQNVPLVIEYVTDEGQKVVPALIEPPFEFLEAKDGDPEGRVLAWNFQNIDYGKGPDKNYTGRKSYIIENIQAIRDYNNKADVVSVKQVDDLAQKMPLDKRDLCDYKIPATK